MSTVSIAAEPRPAVVVLDGVRHGLADPVGGTRELDDAIETARRAERDGAVAVVVPASRHWPATAQALAVLLATETVRVVVEVGADDDPAALVRFAASATRLAGDRLVVAVQGDRAAVAAEHLRRHWDGPVVVGPHGVAALIAPPAPAVA